MSNPKLKKMFAEIEQQARKKRAINLRLSRIAGITFLLFTGIFLFFVPEFLFPLGVLLVAGVIMFYGLQSQPDPDNEDPDGGWDSLWNYNCLVTLVMLLIGFYGLALLVLTFFATLLSKYLEIGIYVSACIAIFYIEHLITSKKKRPSEVVADIDSDCWVCATDYHKDGVFSCPICGFASKAKNPYRGLCAHMDNMHHDAWRNTPLFKRLCNSCEGIPAIKRYIRSSAPLKFGP